MSTISMTGFGKGSSALAGFRADVEISSVNRKQFDCVVSLPNGLASLEERCRKAVAQRLSRGHVQLTVLVVPDNPSEAVGIDSAAISGRMAQIRALAKIAGLECNLQLADFLRLPGVLADVSLFPDPESVWPALSAALDCALSSHASMRLREGAALRLDLEKRLETMEQVRAKIAARAPVVPKAWKETLLRRISELLAAPLSPDDPSVAREVAFVADKCDVSEELTRLSAHFSHAKALFDSDAPSGRKLDFLAQEMNREANTIGSKANDSEIATHVIELKALVETFREQVQNLE